MPGDLDRATPDGLFAPAPSGRIERWRQRADELADRYQREAIARPVLGLPLAFAARYTARQGIMLASACAFRLFLWLMPLALLLAGVLAGISAHSPTSVEAATKRAGITGAASQEVITALKGGGRSWWIAVIVGAASFLWTTRTLMRCLALINAHVWGVTLPKRRQKEILLDACIFSFGWLAVFAAVAGVAKIDHLIPGGVFIVGLIQATVLAGAWFVIVQRLPDRRAAWTDLLPGCVLFGVGFAALHAVSRVYLPSRIEHASQVYGALGIAASILAWLLIIGQVIVGTTVVNVVWFDYRRERRTTRQPLPDDVDRGKPE